MESTHDLEKKYFTQQEVADLFRVSPGTIKNWREAGLLDYLQVPGSTRVLYPIDAVRRFEEENLKHTKVMPLRTPVATRKTEGQDLSPTRFKKAWRI